MYLVGKFDEGTNRVDYHSVCKNMAEVKAIVMRWAVSNKLETDILNVFDDRNVIVKHYIEYTVVDVDNCYSLSYHNDTGTHLYGFCLDITINGIGEHDISTDIHKLADMRSTVCKYEIVAKIHDKDLVIGYATTPEAASRIMKQIHISLDGSSIGSRTNPKYNPLDKSRMIVLCDAIKTMLQNDGGMLL